MDVRGNERLRFGDFEFDSLSKRLFRGQRRVKIQPQPLRVWLRCLRNPAKSFLANICALASGAILLSSSLTRD